LYVTALKIHKGQQDALTVPLLARRGSCMTGLACTPTRTLLAALDVHPRVAMQILQHSKIAVGIHAEVPSAGTRAALGKLGPWLGSGS
jgi:hypothetical protein